MDTLVHLAGAGIGDKRWTSARKQEILESRVRSTAILVDFLRTHEHSVKTVIAASAIGYYGFGSGTSIFTEESAAGSDFLASVVVRWEQETERFKELGVRLVKPRIGVVLSSEGGALKEIVRPIQWGIGAPLGDGKQIMSWIHIDDLCEFIAYTIEHAHTSGVYNAVAPHPATNKALTYEIARQLKRRIMLPPVPDFVLRLILGQMADLVTKGSKVVGFRTAACGFQFRFPDLRDALADQLRRPV